LLMDALESDADLLCSLDPGLILEVGSGSGCVINFVTKFLASELGRETASLAIDLNRQAVLETLRCSQRPLNRVHNFDAIQASFLDGLRPAHQFDLVIFNPPYVPSEDSDACSSLNSHSRENLIDAAWAGGPRGRLCTDRLLDSLCLPHPDGRSFLSPGAVVYIVALEYNDPEELLRLASQRWKFRCATVVLERLAGIERLSILRLKR